jgi:hypothetical protein
MRWYLISIFSFKEYNSMHPLSLAAMGKKHRAAAAWLGFLLAKLKLFCSGCRTAGDNS